MYHCCHVYKKVLDCTCSIPLEENQKYLLPLLPDGQNTCATIHVTPSSVSTATLSYLVCHLNGSQDQRTKKKVWGVIFNCLSSRAVHVDVSEDYGIDSILQVIRKFMCIRKCPAEFISDRGS